MPPLTRAISCLLLACATSSVVVAQTGSVVTVNADNVLLINGRQVFPIGFFSGPPINGRTPSGADALQELRDAGALIYRMIQTGAWNNQVISNEQAALDWAYQHDMYCWVNLRELSYFSDGDTNTPARLRQVVDKFANHPAVGVWANQDEAWWGKISVARLLNGYDVIKLGDTNHPVIQNHAPRGTVADLQPYNVAADLLSLDIYPVTASGIASNPPIANTQISQVGDWTRVLAQVANGQKGYWLIEQIAFSGTTPPGKTLIFPTFTQSRYMAYQAIVNGARGLIFFGGDVAATLNVQDAPLGWNWTFWNSVLKQVVQELGDHSLLANALVAPVSAMPITMSGTTDPDVEFCVREVAPYVYVLATKREGATLNVTFSGLPIWAGTGEVLYEAPRTVPSTNGCFSDTFAPFDVHVYRFNLATTAPFIIRQPQDQLVTAGQSATLAVNASGSPPLACQWLFNGTVIPGATNSSLILTSPQDADSGLYSVVVTNLVGSVASSNALLTVVSLGLWGDNSLGQTALPPWMTNVIAVAAGAWHNLALRVDGTVLGWGCNSQGQCDAPAWLRDALAIAAGGYHSLAIRADGTVLAWGGNDSGQTDVPAGLKTVLAVSAGTWHSLALRRDGTVVAWGDNSFGQTHVPGGLTGLMAIAAGGNHNLALRANGTVVAWGEDTDANGAYSGQCAVPIALTNVVAVAAGDYHSLAVRGDGSVVAWGDDSQGQCDIPAGLSNVVAVAGGGAHTLALRADGTVVGWGANRNGQARAPAYLANLIAIGAGENHSLALVAGGVPAARLLSPVWQPGGFSVLVQSLNRRNYALDWKSSLTAANWNPLSTNAGNGALKLLLDPSATDQQRFYHLRQW